MGGVDAYGGKVVFARFKAQLGHLLAGGFRLEQGMVDVLGHADIRGNSAQGGGQAFGTRAKQFTGDLAFDTQYRELLQNYGNINVLAGLTGQVGAATSQALGGQAEEMVSGFVESWRRGRTRPKCGTTS